jgi:ABC-type Fe3+ transport system permease subunit
VGQARLAILGGAVLVGLVVLAEFGAFEILGFRTLTTEIYTEFTVGFNAPAACAFSLILVVLGAAPLLGGERAARGRPGRPARCGRGAPDAAGAVGALPAPPQWPGWDSWSRWPWGARGVDHLPHRARGQHDDAARLVLGAAGNTFFYSACAGLLATAAALPDRPPLHPLPPAGRCASWSGPTC